MHQLPGGSNIPFVSKVIEKLGNGLQTDSLKSVEYWSMLVDNLLFFRDKAMHPF